MRLLTLEFQALGPFPERHKIDFTKFEPSGLYLLKGQTGSGKSTIIDAITFALYGRVAGGSTSTMQRLRSNHADRNTDTFVRLRFETSHGTFEVVRRPTYIKEGNKTETPGTATLVKITQPTSSTGEGDSLFGNSGTEGSEEIATGVTSVDNAIPEIVGLGLNQFLQTVVLPQGKFANFIHSRPIERKDLLEEIFGTEHFRRFTESLRQQSREAQEIYENNRNRVLIQAEDLSPIIREDVDAEQYEKAVGFALTQLGFHERARDRQAQVVEEYQASLDELVATQNERERAVEATDQWREATATLTQLDEESDQHKADIKQLALAREAAKVSADVAADRRAKQALEDARGDVAQAQDKLRGETSSGQLSLQDSLETADIDLVAVADGVLVAPEADQGMIDERLDELTREHTRIETAEQDVEQLTKLRKLLSELEKKQNETEARINTYENKLQKFGPAEKDIETAIAKLEELGDKLPDLQKAESKLETRYQAALEAYEQREQLKEAAEEIGLRKRELSQTKAAATNALVGWLNDSALDLAERLVDGQPCLVCGSTDHPDPITGDHTETSADAVREAQEKVNAAKVALETVQARQREITQRIVKLNEKAGGDSASLEIALSEAKEATQGARRATAQAREIRKDLEVARKEADETKSALAENKTSLSVIKSEQTQAQTEIEKLSKAIEQARGDFESVTKRREYLSERRARVQSLSRALQAWLNAYQTSVESAQRLARALEESQFDSIQDAEDAVLDQDAISNLEQQIRTYDLRREFAERKRDEAVGTGLIREVIPRSLSNAISQTQNRLDQARDAYADAKIVFETYRSKVERLRVGIEQLETQRAESGPLRRLSKLAQGASIGDGDKIPFDTWVITRQFERVLDAANPYLLRFSSGRYELRRIALDSTLRRNQSGGLGLAIYDSETEDDRAPTSLSGGETFYCSLAMALGLVEVVSSEAGGINLQSMLIDEGFGSLDADTLDQVMIGLGRLRDSGRTVGVVSHVAEMQRRISDGIEVKVRPEGGSTLAINAS